MYTYTHVSCKSEWFVSETALQPEKGQERHQSGHEYKDSGGMIMNNQTLLTFSFIEVARYRMLMWVHFTRHSKKTPSKRSPPWILRPSARRKKTWSVSERRAHAPFSHHRTGERFVPVGVDNPAGVCRPNQAVTLRHREQTHPLFPTPRVCNKGTPRGRIRSRDFGGCLGVSGGGC